MVDFSTGSNQLLSYIAESTYNTTPTVNAANPMLPVRKVSTSLKATRTPFQSQEIRSDQQIADFRLGVKQTSGDIGFELSYNSYDDFLEATLGGSWAITDTDTDTDWSVTAGDTLTKTGGGLTSLFSVNDVINVSGFVTNPNNNGSFKVAAVTATTVQINQSVLTVESSGPTVTVYQVTGGTLTSGLAVPSFTIERGLTDTGDYLVFPGVVMNGVSLSISPSAMTTGTFSTLGGNLTTSTSSLGTPQPANTFRPMDSFNGNISWGGSSVPVTSLDLTLTRNIGPALVIGNDGVEAYLPGRNSLTGTASVYFKDLGLMDDFLDETTRALVVTVSDSSAASANTYTFTIPKVALIDDDPALTNEQGVIQNVPFQALLDPVTGTNMTITR